ncbi:hypothetical protein XHC_0236 [Xanthomonas hortorum pv. carotae str. M081]|nr:hypothetical protein XHC_0236 [Xanthomonas hortorum pv. carotae str. M081]
MPPRLHHFKRHTPDGARRHRLSRVALMTRHAAIAMRCRVRTKFPAQCATRPHRVHALAQLAQMNR